jgi:two-component system, OmpR family, sensor histidine kinase QseC
MRSIRIRLLLFVVLAFAMVWAVVSFLAYREALHEAEELFDAEMAQSAQVLLTVTLHEIEEGDDKTIKLEHQTSGHRYVTKIAFQVWDDDSLLFHSDNAPKARMSTVGGYSDQWIDGEYWRVFVLTGSNNAYSVQVGQLHEVRDELVHEIAQSLSLPLIVALPVLALLFWWGISRGLRPLQRVADEVAQRSPQEMSPLVDSGIPTEIRPLTRALNNLLQQLRGAFERERRFTADAAHELRTPLASIKTQSQVAQRATAEEERQQALRQINVGVDRATHLVEQLLTLARLDPGSAMPDFKPVSFCHLLEEVVAEMAPQAHAKEIDIGMVECQHCSFIGSEASLAILMRNLLDNAIRYTPQGGAVDASVAVEQQRLIFTVTDSGPGVPEAERSQVLERFYRGAMEGQAPGCGLGLSIVKRIAELHGATLMLDSPESGVGLRVSVSFPL